MPGLWLSCDSVAIRARPGIASEVVRRVRYREEFEVLAANVVVLAPGLVRVTRPLTGAETRLAKLFQPGDTLGLLNYLGEGRFNVWHSGGVLELEAFWPVSEQSRRASGDYAGEVVRPSRTEFWLRVVTNDSARGWVRRDRGRVLDPLERRSRPMC